MYHLVTIGDPVIDTHVQIDDKNAVCRENDQHDVELCLPYGKKIPIINSFQALGGNAANVAVGARRLGLKTALITTVGNDTTATMVLNELHQRDVATEYVTVDPQCSTRYSVVLNFQAERTILAYSDRKKYVWPEKLAGTDWIYYTGLGEGFETMQTKLLTYLREHPTTSLAFNPGSYMMAYAPAAVQEIVKKTDLLIVNLEEAEALAQTTLEQEKSMGSILHKLLAAGPEEVVITDGERGAWAGTYDGVWHLPTFPVKVVSKTGAGDAFSSGYLAARHFGHDIPTAISWGIADSCGVIQEHGAQTGLLDQDGIEDLIKHYKRLQPQAIY